MDWQEAQIHIFVFSLRISPLVSCPCAHVFIVSPPEPQWSFMFIFTALRKYIVQVSPVWPRRLSTMSTSASSWTSLTRRPPPGREERGRRLLTGLFADLHSPYYLSICLILLRLLFLKKLCPPPSTLSPIKKINNNFLFFLLVRLTVY